MKLFRISVVNAIVLTTSMLLMPSLSAQAQSGEMFDWGALSKSVAAAAKVHETEEAWEAAPDGTYQATKDAAIKQVAESCPTVIGSLPKEARPGLLVDFDAFCECYDDQLIKISVTAMFKSHRMGVDGKSMEERRAAWENLFDIPHEQRLGGCVVKTTELQ